MLASPSIQQIASALAPHPSQVPTVRASSRVLCLKLEPQASSGLKRSSRTGSMAAVCEAFLKFSPRVQLRVDRSGGARHVSDDAFDVTSRFIFIDVASTSHLFKGEAGLMASAVSLARDLGFGVQCAVADTPAGAQAFATAYPQTISPPGEERERLKDLSLPHLLHLEGLKSWDQPRAVESMITFFMMLGFRNIGDLSRFTSFSFRERWGEVGELLWKRLNAQDHQPISPLFPTEPLEDYAHLDFPVSLVSLLLHQVQRSFDFLFARLQGRRMVAQRLKLTLHCEYSSTRHEVMIEPNTPSRDRELFATLLENKLSALDLENPIRDFEVSVIPTPESTRQLDFFEPRDTDREKVDRLFSLLSQSELRPGFYQIESAILPERGWQLVSNLPVQTSTSEMSLTTDRSPEPRTKRRKERTSKATVKNSWAAARAASMVAEESAAYEADLSRAIAPQAIYGDSVMRAPRPTRLLSRPAPLNLETLQRLKILTSQPIERLDHGWWEKIEAKRDYYFALSPEGECLWIYQDRKTDEYFLHGFFD